MAPQRRLYTGMRTAYTAGDVRRRRLRVRHRGPPHARRTTLLAQYGLQRVLKDAFESTALSEAALGRLKKDLDRIADSYDSIRFYQYPVDGTLAITILKEKKWRRLIVKA